MLIYESMHSLLVLYDYIGSYVIQNMVAKTGPKVVKTGTSTLPLSDHFWKNIYCNLECEHDKGKNCGCLRSNSF